MLQRIDSRRDLLCGSDSRRKRITPRTQRETPVRHSAVWVGLQRRVEAFDRASKLERVKERDCSVENRLSSGRTRGGEMNSAEFLHRRDCLPVQSRDETERSKKNETSRSAHHTPGDGTSIGAGTAASIVSLVVSRRKGSEKANTDPVSGNSAHARPP